MQTAQNKCIGFRQYSPYSSSIFFVFLIQMKINIFAQICEDLVNSQPQNLPTQYNKILLYNLTKKVSRRSGFDHDPVYYGVYSLLTFNNIFTVSGDAPPYLKWAFCIQKRTRQSKFNNPNSPPKKRRKITHKKILNQQHSSVAARGRRKGSFPSPFYRYLLKQSQKCMKNINFFKFLLILAFIETLYSLKKLFLNILCFCTHQNIVKI
eukprot:TRINITY_DN29372_c0_g2_i1.p1 TRINITY_DN29372_c0_g2~~TRINITY_DN29372_c0_g2_i1.p1  ORF type:complete len:244 (+),score=-5.06 TRINITY_DN29372_c0_g2_i1:109-732(+)